MAPAKPECAYNLHRMLVSMIFVDSSPHCQDRFFFTQDKRAHSLLNLSHCSNSDPLIQIHPQSLIIGSGTEPTSLISSEPPSRVKNLKARLFLA